MHNLIIVNIIIKLIKILGYVDINLNDVDSQKKKKKNLNDVVHVNLGKKFIK